jgi:hypothetical protein
MWRLVFVISMETPVPWGESRGPGGYFELDLWAMLMSLDPPAQCFENATMSAATNATSSTDPTNVSTSVSILRLRSQGAR